MKMIPTVATNLFFPASRRSLDAFEQTASFLSGLGVRGMEFYHDGPDAGALGGILRRHGLRGVYIAVIPLKEQQLHLCSVDEEVRQKAVVLAKSCVEQAADGGIDAVMFNSGRPQEGREDAGLDALYHSFSDLFEYKEKKGYAVSYEMEPCDSRMDARQLIGPYRRTKAFLEKLHSSGLPLKLTLDSAHTVEEGESFPEALKALKPYCNHVHFANCRIDDPEDPLYGDKHLGYEYAGSVWTFEAIRGFFPALERLYPGDEEVMAGLEVLCREEDPFSYFAKTWAELPQLHQPREKQ